MARIQKNVVEKTYRCHVREKSTGKIYPMIIKAETQYAAIASLPDDVEFLKIERETE